MAIFIPRWEKYKDKKPSGPVDVNWNNDLTRGLVELILPHTKISSVNGIIASTSGLPYAIGSPDIGECVVGNAAFGQSNLYQGAWSRITAPLTFLVEYKITTLPTVSSRCSGSGSPPNSGYIIGPSTTNFRCFISRDGTSVVATGGAISKERKFDAMVVDTTNLAYYENGKLTVSPFAHGGMTTSDTDFFVGANATLGVTINGYYGLHILYNKALTADRISTLYENPYQLLKPRNQFFFLGGANETADIVLTTVNPTIAIGASQLQHTDAAITTTNPTIAAELSQTLHADVAITTVNPTIAATVNETVVLASVALTTQNPIIAARITGGEPDYVLGGVPLHSEVKRGKRRWETDEEYEAEYNENVPADNPIIKLDGSVTKIKESMDNAKKQADKKDEDDVKAIVQFVKEYRSNIISTWLN